ncbi:MAG: type II toxin-antitoxin system HicA family toxin [Taibaiella sp.]|nr:type II toxin-antitoxin system HicA family toxin [Taibaiella sp.]
MAVTAKQLVKALQKKRFALDNQTGSHAIYKNENSVRVVVPIHGKKDIGPGLLRQILNDANISLEELEKLIR